MDYNVIQSRNNGSANDLFLNYYGGNIYIGQSGLFGVHVAPNGTVGINASNWRYTLNVNASAALNGINVTDPVNNYILYSNESGPGIGLYVAKTSASSDFGATIYSLNNGNGASIHAKQIMEQVFQDIQQTVLVFLPIEIIIMDCTQLIIILIIMPAI